MTWGVTSMARQRGNKHHPAFDGPRWEAVRKGHSTSVNKRIRCELLRTALMDIDVHEELHRKVSFVPMPGRHFLHRVEANFIDDPNPIKRIGNFLIASEHALIHPQMTYIETDCAELMIEAISLQLPYIREGLINPNGTV